MFGELLDYLECGSLGAYFELLVFRLRIESWSSAVSANAEIRLVSTSNFYMHSRSFSH